jgi:hypothetical protein
MYFKALIGHKLNMCTHPYEGIVIVYDVSSNARTLLCRYCEATEDYNFECQTPMRTLHFCMVLVLMYVLCCVGIVRQQKNTIMNIKS